VCGLGGARMRSTSGLRFFAQIPRIEPDSILAQFTHMKLAQLLHLSPLRVSPIRVCGLGGARMSSTSGLRFVVPKAFRPTLATQARQSAVPVWRSADFQVCSAAGFQTRWSQGCGADLEVGGTAGLETCATPKWQMQIPCFGLA
jgi:hypothetical protein